MARQEFAQRLKATPAQPGVYLMKGTKGEVLYVGKAAVLRNRLRSYFGSPAGLEPKIRQMVSRVAEFEYIVTQSDSEAIILENNFIKRHKPHYNARLKDDKSYPYIKIDLKEDFPQVYFTRRVQPDGARYFGPFASAGSVRKTMDLLKKLFPYRSCTKTITGTDPRPCLEYYIHRCVAPCIGAVDKQGYREVIQQVLLFLEGRTDAITRDLRRKMLQAAESLEFERAALLRDQIQAIERVSETQKVVSPRNEDQDVIALAQGRNEAWVEVFSIRRGKLIGRDHFTMEGTQDEEPGYILGEFVKQFYDSTPYVPPRLLLQAAVEDAPIIEEWLSKNRRGKVTLTVPQRGEKLKLVQMVADNATQGLEQLRVKWLSDTAALQQAMEELQEVLNLPHLPRRMECYDISNIQGTNPVGSMVVFEDGAPKNTHYRRFKVKTVSGVDDYAMMQEMLRRRFRHLATRRQAVEEGGSDSVEGGKTLDNGQYPGGKKEESWGIIPDLVLIDGGKGHLSAASQVFLELGIDFIPLASIAKQREELFLPHMPEPLLLPRTSPGLHLAQRIRDEAHRFAVTFHRQRRSKASVQSALDLISGIGPRRKRQLLRKFGSVRTIREAPLQELAAVPGMTLRLAQKLKEYL